MKTTCQKFLLLCLLVILPGTSFATWTDEELRQEMVRELDIIEGYFNVCYAPCEWKKQHFDWDIHEEVERAKQSIWAAESISVKEYHRIVRRIFVSARDYHVGVRFHATESARLAFSIHSAEGRYFIAHIDRSKLSYAAFPFSVGDKVISIDGQPIEDLCAEIKDLYYAGAAEGTDQMLAEKDLTFREAARAHIVPRGPVMVAIEQEGQERRCQLIWDYQPERIHPCGVIAGSVGGSSPPFPGREILQVQSPILNMSAMHQLNSSVPSSNPFDVGSSTSLVGPLGQVIWENDPSDLLSARVYQTADRKQIGFVRIPLYMGGDVVADEFEAIVSKFQWMTDGLVVDQMNNPGGDLIQAWAMASMLTDQPLANIKHRVMINPETVSMAISVIDFVGQIQDECDAHALLGPSINGYPCSLQTLQFLVEFCRFIVDEWTQGHFLTEPFFLLGVDQLNPHPRAQYTKPILVLANHLSFSCGDVFPAVLQDNGRAKVMGTRTAGAGGSVNAKSFPSRLGIDMFTLTWSLAERVDLNPIENLGVTPDILYEFTADDLRTAFMPFTQAVLEEIEILIDNANDNGEDDVNQN